jgi:hypothetical protein
VLRQQLANTVAASEVIRREQAAERARHQTDLARLGQQIAVLSHDLERESGEAARLRERAADADYWERRCGEAVDQSRRLRGLAVALAQNWAPDLAALGSHSVTRSRRKAIAAGMEFDLKALRKACGNE